MRETIIEYFASTWWAIILAWVLIFLMPVWILYLDKFSQIALRKKLDDTWLGAFIPWASMFYGWIILLFFAVPSSIFEWLIITISIALVFFLIPKNLYIEKKFYFIAYDGGASVKDTLNSPYKRFIMCHWWANNMYFFIIFFRVFLMP